MHSNFFAFVGAILKEIERRRVSSLQLQVKDREKRKTFQAKGEKESLYTKIHKACEENSMRAFACIGVYLSHLNLYIHEIYVVFARLSKGG